MLCLKGQAFLTFRNALEAGQLSAGPNCTDDVTWSWFKQLLLKVFSINPMAEFNRQQRLRALDITSAQFRGAHNAMVALFMEYVGARGMGSPVALGRALLICRQLAHFRLAFSNAGSQWGGSH